MTWPAWLTWWHLATALWLLGAFEVWIGVIYPLAGQSITTPRRFALSALVALLWPVDAAWRLWKLVRGLAVRLLPRRH